MKRPEYHYPSNTSVIPTGYVAITLEEYRELIETCTKDEAEEQLKYTAFEILDDLLKTTVKKNAELQAQVDEFKAFLAKEPYAQKMLDGYREYMKRKQEAETSEGDSP